MQEYELTVDVTGLKLQPHPDRGGKSATDPPRQITAPRTGLARFSGAATLRQLATFLDAAMDRPVF